MYEPIPEPYSYDDNEFLSSDSSKSKLIEPCSEPRIINTFKDVFSSRLTSKETTSGYQNYEDYRIANRYGNGVSFLYMWVAMTGTCYFNYHYVISKAGIFWSLFLNCVVCYTISYGLYITTRLADILEKEELDRGNDILIRVYHEIPETMKSKLAYLYKPII